jgi:hypothetical protein
VLGERRQQQQQQQHDLLLSKHGIALHSYAAALIITKPKLLRSDLHRADPAGLLLLLPMVANLPFHATHG